MLRRALTCLALLATAACHQDVVTGAADAAPVRDDAPSAAARDDATARDDAAPLDSGGSSTNEADGALPFADARPRDAAPADDAALDASTALACHVDRFSPCADPDEATGPNNTPGDSTYLNGIGVGCVQGDMFTPAMARVDSRICHNEPADWFEVTYVPCDTLTMLVTIELTIDTPCEPGAFELRVSNRPCDGTNPDVECTTSGNVQRIRFPIPPSRSVGSLDFGVVRVSEAVAADYRLTYQLAR